MKPRRFVRLFKPTFAQLVRSGEKTQTVRPAPKRMPEAGDIIDCREWSGDPYRSKQRKLVEATITGVHRIAIDEAGIICANKRESWKLSSEQLWHFSRADGFLTPQDMLDWFDHEHGLPFEGIVIYWKLE